MGPTIRVATDADLGAVVALTAARRRKLAVWSPTWWNPSAAADDLHPLWLQHLLDDEHHVVRLADDHGTAVACAASVPQGEQWFVDDVAVDDGRWADAGVALLEGVDEVPALTCFATLDDEGRAAAANAGLAHVSSYWLAEPVDGEIPTARLPDPDQLGEPPPHTFGEVCDVAASGALAFADRGGAVTGSPPLPAPPIYDPGGTVAVIDRVQGPDLAGLVRAARSVAARRGDVLVNVIVGVGDGALAAVLDDAGFVRTVDVYGWPDEPTWRGTARP